ncbi:bifunctional hydroxymethylpyrimidine kinase/phosphomethylpyrimidine kinase [Candidatus Sumerlaeota bacterium]|nr:bifunctional hydroxymethylpyrimidine kinase/phosphomethylpyrimidine kinase [Candidatus Sumerlaeota bacterium]
MTIRVMTIAGSDSGGGAGIQADLKTFQNLGVFGMSAITALTAQNTLGVQDIHAVPSRFVECQMRSVFSDIGIDAVKTGMLLNASIIRIVAGTLREFNMANIVVDPVMVSKSGARLLKKEAESALSRDILPLAMIVTPNLDEASVITGREITNLKEMKESAEVIMRMGARAVLIKGGHRKGDASIDLFFDGDEFMEYTSPRLDISHTHGTGCTLSAALAAYIGMGKPLREAVGLAKEYVTEAIRHAHSIGHGISPVNHLWMKRHSQKGSLT